MFNNLKSRYFSQLECNVSDIKNVIVTIHLSIKRCNNYNKMFTRYEGSKITQETGTTIVPDTDNKLSHKPDL